MSNKRKIVRQHYLIKGYHHNYRKQILKLHNNKCDICSIKNNLQLHHKRYSRRFGDVMILCKNCHRQLHNPIKRRRCKSIMSRESRIFTNNELKVMEDRMRGDKSDSYGLYCNRIKPKIIELLTWFSKRKMLRRLVKKKGGK